MSRYNHKKGVSLPRWMCNVSLVMAHLKMSTHIVMGSCKWQSSQLWPSFEDAYQYIQSGGSQLAGLANDLSSLIKFKPLLSTCFVQYIVAYIKSTNSCVCMYVCMYVHTHHDAMLCYYLQYPFFEMFKTKFKTVWVNPGCKQLMAHCGVDKRLWCNQLLVGVNQPLFCQFNALNDAVWIERFSFS